MSHDHLAMAVEQRPFQQPLKRELGHLHVPFDDITSTTSCEHALRTALLDGDTVGLIAHTGNGKTSALEAVTSLHGRGTTGNHPEQFFPIGISVHITSEEIAQDEISFAHALTNAVRSATTQQQPPEGVRKHQIAAEPKITLPEGPSFALGIEASREIGQLLAPNPASASVEDSFDILNEVMETIRHDHHQPVLIFDDTDTWLGTAVSNSPDARARFFSLVPRILTELVPVSAVVAVQPLYQQDASYTPARQFLKEIHIPRLGHQDHLEMIINRRLETHGLRFTADKIIDHGAIAALFTHYTSTDASIRGLISIIDAAVNDAHETPGIDTVTEHLMNAQITLQTT